VLYGYNILMLETSASKLFNKLVSTTPTTSKKIKLNVALVVIYIAAGKFGLMFASVNPSASAIWLGTGIAISAVVLFGYEMWPAILIGAFITNATTAGTFGTSFAIAAGNTLEGLLGGYFINNFANGKMVFEKSIDTVAFFVLAGMLSPMVSATIGTSSLLFAGLAQADKFKQIWITWWFGDMAGAFLLVPFIVLWVTSPKIQLSIKKTFELICLIGLIGLTSKIAFGSLISLFPVSYPINFIIIPPLLWGAVRFKRKESAALMLLTAILATIGVLRGFSNFAISSVNESLVLLQSWLVVTSASILLLSVTLSEKKRTESALASREKYFRSLIEKNYDAITTVDRNGKILYTSPSSSELFGYEMHEVVGLNGFDFLYPGEQDKAKEAINELIKKPNGVMRAETKILHKKGIWLFVESIVTNLLEDPDINALVVNYRDITERKTVEEKKNEFIAMISQQLRIPMGNVEKYTTSLINHKGGMTGLQEKYLKEIETENKNMVRLVDNLIKMSRIGLQTLELQIQNVSLTGAVDAVVKAIRPRINGKEIILKIKTDSKGRHPEILTDYLLFSSLLTTIFIQAIGRTEKKGVLSVEFNNRKDKVSIKFSPNADLVKNKKTLLKHTNGKSNIRSIERYREEAEFFVAKALAAYMNMEILDDNKKPGRSITLVMQNSPQG
jgi:PAS domain S-box-containing protein